MTKPGTPIEVTKTVIARRCGDTDTVTIQAGSRGVTVEHLGESVCCTINGITGRVILPRTVIHAPPQYLQNHD